MDPLSKATLAFGEDVMRCFISDRTRKGYASRTRELTLSRIFDGCAGDFKNGRNGLIADVGR